MTKNKFFVSALLSVFAAIAAIALPNGLAGDRLGTGQPEPFARSADPCAEASRGETCNPSNQPQGLTEYLVCSALAETRILSGAEALVCLERFLAVKLSFIAGYEPQTYRQMPLEEQIEMNRRAYIAFRQWSKSDPRFAQAKCEISAKCDEVF